ILAYATANYNLQNFNNFYLGLEGRPAYQAGRWWTGDEDMDWLGFSDINENGIWDPDEPINDDVGEDGLSPTSPNYPGRDVGEGDGRPTSGEPNFDTLDKDESDQIGLTGFAVFNVHDYELLDDAQNYDIFSRAVPPFEDILLEGGRNLGMFFSSGPFPLKSGQTERFSMALLFAEKDYTDPRNISNSALARKKETVQQIYNADYRFARPPNKPLVEVIPGDGMVTLTWDDLAEQSFDPFLREFDFEGYMIFRSTEPNFEENLTITDAFGNRTFQKPIAQFDLVNGLRGPHPVSVNGVQFNLGTDSGLKHTFIDRDVRNGQTYYYAVVAYDRGLVARDADSTVVTTPDGMVRGLAPSLTSAVIKNDVAGNVVADVNTGYAVPRTPAAGYIGPAFDNIERSVTGTGTIDIEIVAPGLVTESADYELTFQNPSLWQNESEVEYELINKTAGTTVVSGIVTNGIAEVAPFEGFVVDMVSPTAVSVTDATTRLTDEQTTFRPAVRPASRVPLVQSRFIAVPDDFVLHFTEGISDTSSVLGFGMLAIHTPFYIVNSAGERQEFIVIEENPDLRDGQYNHGERIVLAMGVEPGLPPIRAGGAWRVSWSIEVVPPDPVLEPDIPVIPPAAGSTLAFETSKPFQTGDRVAFSVRPPELDNLLATNQMGDIFVVPNPYVATSEFEPPNVYRAGRGERRIYFMNLPRQCTIRVYTISGQLVQTLEHESSIDDGQLAWDLVQRDGMTISYGIYLYHVDAPGVGEHVGRFGVIK
ncbi:MAG TPA: hypothetical protein VJB15_00800, partial [Rhodothermia bacterium]|nr:hypothetical protein [Rhodothermia bacterium]